jgi:hypothetical protein
MEENRHIWQNWIDTLHQWGMKEIAAAFLEAAGPLNFIGAQAVYLGQPVLRTFLPDDYIRAFAGLLENQEEVNEFVEKLRRQRI